MDYGIKLELIQVEFKCYMHRSVIITTIVVSLLLGLNARGADGNNSRVEELIDKHQSKIAKAKLNDWKTYAECANELVSMQIANEEILSWINKSIQIKETVYNRTVKGDFLVLENKLREAKKEYVRAIELARNTSEEKKIPDLQWKILVAMGLENYHDFHAVKE